MSEAFLYDTSELQPEGWEIKNLEDADWALERLAELEREISENIALEAAAVERIRLRTAKLNERATRQANYFEAKLRQYAEAHRDELITGKRKSRALLHGQLGWRKTGGGLEVREPAKLLAWAQAQPIELELVRIKEEPALKKISERYASTGEVPDGCEPKPEEETFYVKVDGAGRMTEPHVKTEGA